MNIALIAVAVGLICLGLAGAVVPMLPGIPLIYAGIWIIAAVDQFRHLGKWWLVSIAIIGGVGLGVDLLAAALGAKRVGASRRAVWGALIGTGVGLAFGLPGIIVGPFLGAIVGELASGSGAQRAADVGIGTWLGLILGALVKLVTSLMMIALLAAGWISG